MSLIWGVLYQKFLCIHACTVVSRKRAPMDCPPIPQFCLDFLLRSKTYLKDRPPSAALQIWIFHRLASLHENVVSLVYTHCKVQIMLLRTILHRFQHTILIARISSHPVSAQGKVYRPWGLFRETTVHVL